MTGGKSGVALLANDVLSQTWSFQRAIRAHAPAERHQSLASQVIVYRSATESARTWGTGQCDNELAKASAERRLESFDNLLGHQAHCPTKSFCVLQLLHFHHRRRSPLSIQRGAIRPVCSNVQGEVILRRGQPIRHLVRRRRRGRHVKSQRSVGSQLQVLVLGSERVALQAIRLKEVGLVVESERPKATHWRQRVFRERDAVLATAVQSSAAAVKVPVEKLRLDGFVDEDIGLGDRRPRVVPAIRHATSSRCPTSSGQYPRPGRHTRRVRLYDQAVLP